MTNSSNFPLSENICASFLNNISTGHRILGWHFFSLSTKKKKCHFLFASTFSNKKFVDILFVVSLSCFHGFLLCVHFSEVQVSSVLLCISLDLSCLEFYQLLKTVDVCPLPNFGSFPPLFLQVLFRMYPFSLLFPGH